MKNQNRNQILRIACSFYLVLAAFIAVNAHRSVACAAGADRIYYFNMDDKGLEGSMMLVQTDGHWGLVDAGHTNATTIKDASGRTYSTTVNGLSSQVYCRNGADVANYMINTLGVRHLDFIIGTHAHADHVGGIPGVAAATYKDASGRTCYLVDSTTTYYYKEYQHISDLEDDLAKYSSDSWHNQAFAWQAKVAMANKGANLVDVSKAEVIHGDPGNAYGDYITFTVGNMSFRLYNVYEQTNTGNENVNSIVTVLTNGNYSVVNLSDVNTNNGAIDKTAAAIAKDFSSVDVVVAGHHGYSNSNTKSMFDSLQPDFVIVPNGQESSWLYTDCDLAAAIPYASSKYGTDFYNLSISPYAVVTDLSGRQVFVYSVSGKGDLTNAINRVMQSAKKTGWASWAQTGGTLWMYLVNGNPVKNAWRRVDGKMYHFDSDGIMQTGWFTDGGGTRWLDGDGALATGWRLLGGKWYFFESNKGYRLTNCWQRVDGKMYRFDSNGIMQTGWYTDGGGTRYLDSNGALTVGWKQIGGKWYYFEGNKGYRLQSKWQRINGKMYYFDADGSMHTGWLTDNGGTRYLDGSGALVTGWQKIGGKWYLFENSKGYKQTLNGWYRLEGTMHYFDSDGTMHTGWLTDSGGTRYLDTDGGSLATGWRRLSGKWYYFESENGYRLQNTWQRIEGKMYYFDADGSMHTGWLTDGGGTRWLDGNGALATGWRQLNGKWYYLESENGYRLQSTWQRINGKMYYFDADGSMHVGWLTDGGGTRYLDENAGLVTGWKQIDGKWYLFEDSKGYLSQANGWKRLNGKMYCFNADGSMHTGWLTDGGGTRWMDDDGALATGWRHLGGAWYYFESENGYRLQNTWQRIDGKMYFFDGDGVMQTGWLYVDGKTRWMDASGALTTGWQQIGGKWYYFDTGDGNMWRNAKTPDGYYVNADGVWVQ